jgi:hypothetical protein
LITMPVPFRVWGVSFPVMFAKDKGDCVPVSMNVLLNGLIVADLTDGRPTIMLAREAVSMKPH